MNSNISTENFPNNELSREEKFRERERVEHKLRQLDAIASLCRNTRGGRGIWKIMDECRQILAELQKTAPELVDSRYSSIEAWIAQIDIFLGQLCEILEIEPPCDCRILRLPRPWPGMYPEEHFDPQIFQDRELAKYLFCQLEREYWALNAEFRQLDPGTINEDWIAEKDARIGWLDIRGDQLKTFLESDQLQKDTDEYWVVERNDRIGSLDAEIAELKTSMEEIKTSWRHK